MYISSWYSKNGMSWYQCNCCKKYKVSSEIFGGEFLCACYNCMPKIAKKFFNGDTNRTIDFIKCEQWKRIKFNKEERDALIFVREVLRIGLEGAE